jgi:hypothetical protein
LKEKNMKIKFGIAVIACLQLVGCANFPPEPPKAVMELHGKGELLVHKLLGPLSPLNNR